MTSHKHCTAPDCQILKLVGRASSGSLCLWLCWPDVLLAPARVRIQKADEQTPVYFLQRRAYVTRHFQRDFRPLHLSHVLPGPSSRQWHTPNVIFSVHSSLRFRIACCLFISPATLDTSMPPSSPEWDKALRGELYHAFVPELVDARDRCKQACDIFNKSDDVSRRCMVQLWRK
jgi:Maltose acetyltransferase